MKKSTLLFTLIASSTLLVGCATIDPQTGERKDPLEGFNRTMWRFNYNVMDPYVFKPVATGWKEYVPSPIKTAIINVANNLDEPASMVNRFLEGDVQKGMVHFTRFWFNSIFGLGGLIDWASYSKPLKLNEKRRFGDTLGSYGMETGTYVMLPVYGPATPRQDLGNLVDTTYPMLSLLGPWGLLKWTVQAVDNRSKVLGQEGILQNSGDSYIKFREMYLQNLKFHVKDGKIQPMKETLSEEALGEID